LRLLGHRRELAAIVADIGDRVRKDQVMPRIDHGLFARATSNACRAAASS
jgi:hypothetical protein